jgi:hypothetical protein
VGKNFLKEVFPRTPFMQGFHPCTPLKGLLQKSLKNPQNLKNIIYQCFSRFWRGMVAKTLKKGGLNEYESFKVLEGGQGENFFQEVPPCVLPVL